MPGHDPGNGDSIGIVFPATHRSGGVERVAWDVLSYLSDRVAVSFIGSDTPDGLPSGVSKVTVPRWSRVPEVFRPLDSRPQASRILRRRPASTLVSFGAECPPGDVLWVHSVH